MSFRGMAMLLCALAFGCSKEPEPEAEPGAPKSGAAQHEEKAAEGEQLGKATGTEAPEDVPPEATQGLMRGHYKKALVAREALIRADLPAAGAAMNWLATHQRADDLPQELRGLLLDMQRTAAKFEGAGSLREAGDVFAQVLSRCGSCHEATDKGPNVATDPLPEGTTPQAHMQRHHWAAKRMWEGLVTASPERFDEAAEALDEKPLTAKELGTGGLPAADVARLDAHIHGLRAKVAEPETEAGRMELYARTLATCATCHSLMGRGPTPVGDVPDPTAE